MIKNTGMAIWGFIIMFLMFLLGLPAFSQGHDEEKPNLPSLNDRLKMMESAIGKKVRNVSFINQDGKPFSLQTWMDKPILVHLIYTQCRDTCPLISSQVAELATRAGDALGGKFRILSVSYDVDNDTPERLRAFGEKFTHDFSSWSFATAKAADLQGFLNDLGVTAVKNEDGTFQHLNFLTLIDKGGVVTAHVLGESFEVEGFLEVLTAPDGIDLAPGIY